MQDAELLREAARREPINLPSFTLYTLFLVILLLGIAEGSIRVLGLAPPLKYRPSGFTQDPVLPYKPKPNLVHTVVSEEFSFEARHNSQGFRDGEHTLAKPPNTYRIVALGDSFTYGWGVEYDKTYLYILETLANAHWGASPRVEIIKLGIPRSFTQFQRLVLEHYGLQYQPDLILVGFLVNDVLDTALGMDAVRPSSDGYLITRDAASLGDVGMWFFKNFHVARLFLGETLSRISAIRWPLRWDELYHDDGFHEREWKAVEGEFLAMNRLARQTGAQLALVHIPQDADIDSAKWTYPGTRLARFAADAGIPYIDTQPALTEAKKAVRSLLYWPKDGHCTEEGYRIIGQTIASWLIETDLPGALRRSSVQRSTVHH